MRSRYIYNGRWEMGGVREKPAVELWRFPIVFEAILW